MRRFWSPMLAGACLGAFTSTGTPQPTEIRGAAVTLVPKTVAIEQVTIENRRSSPLVAWELRRAARESGAVTSAWDFSGPSGPLAPGAGPIQPNERRTIEMAGSDGRMAEAVSLQLAVFADGHVDGLPAAVARWERERREQLDDARYWMRAFETMPRESEERAREFLAARVAERAGQPTPDRSGTRAQLARLWQRSSSAPGSLFRLVRPIHDEAARQLAALTRTRTSPRTLEPATPVSLTSQRTTRTEYVASIRNLRDVAIEAVGFEAILAGQGRPLGRRSADFCLSDPATIGERTTGRIARGENREFHLGWSIDPSTLPTLRLTFVLFDDLSFEGAASERDWLFRTREEQADDMAFANAVRSELLKLPPDEVLGFLLEKRAERTTHLLREGRGPDLHLLDDLIEHGKHSPERLQEMAPAMNGSVERQRERLLRHRR